jgi:pimeloyl-ACP methyl ester carboxylesterase
VNPPRLAGAAAASAAVVVALLATACGGSDPRAEPAPPPALSERCPDGGEGRTFWFRASDGTRLSGAVLGEGRVGLVLAHGYPSDICEWAGYAPVLAGAGFRVLMFDFRGFGRSARGRTGDIVADIRGAATELRRRGAERIVLIGSSFGGTAVLSAAPTIVPVPAAVVDISGPLDLSGRVSSFSPAAEVAPKIRSPVLLMWGRGDRRMPPDAGRAFLRLVSHRDTSVATFPGAWHGLSLLWGVPGAKNALLAFLRRVS